MNQTQNRRLSQIFTDAPHFHGEIAYAAEIAPGAPIKLVYTPGKVLDQKHMHTHRLPIAEPPSIRWSIGGHAGHLSLASFLALWSEMINRLDGHPIDLDIAASQTLYLPFPALHPSGLFQIIRFRHETQLFHRQILYPSATLPPPLAVAAE